jgi:hypothetical protein
MTPEILVAGTAVIIIAGVIAARGRKLAPVPIRSRKR